jgi:hypothetical protein
MEKHYRFSLSFHYSNQSDFRVNQLDFTEQLFLERPLERNHY